MNHWLFKLIYLSTTIMNTTTQGFALTPLSSIYHSSTTTATTTSNYLPNELQPKRLRQGTALAYKSIADPELPGIVLRDFADDLTGIKRPKEKEDDKTTRKATTTVKTTTIATSKTTSLDDVDITFGLPTVIRPKNKEHAKQFLSKFLQEHKEWIDRIMLRYGAVLFRGFDHIDTAQDVEDTIRSFNPKLSNQYRGTSPRNTQGGTVYVFSAAEVPSHWPIAQHIEMSFLPAPPKQLYFSALEAPKTIGGETALADFRKVYQDLPSKLRTKLATKKLRYTRTHHKVVVKHNTHDVASMLSWPDMFGTSNKNDVERMAIKEGMGPIRWEGKNKDVFVNEFQSEPFQLHPTSNVPVFFNHANVFHWTSFPMELFAAFRRTKDWRFFSHGVKVGIKSIWEYGLLRNKMALHVAFGDGTPISIWEMHQIRKAIHNNMVYERWQKGDIMLIDNFSTSHGRQPTYDNGRNIVVAWSDPINKSNEA